MRTTPLIGRKVWFAPRRFGWGLNPASIEGWAVTAAAFGVSYAVKRREVPERAPTQAQIAVALVAIALLKGTRPGGPRARRIYKAARLEAAQPAAAGPTDC